jgi:CheY-like chemotaxis protein
MGLSTPFAVVCFLRMRRQKEFIGVGMLSLGFLLWAIYLGSFPFPREFGNFYDAGFFIAALLQLFIAFSMVVLLFREIRRDAEQVRAQIEGIRLEKEALLSKAPITTEECQTLYDRIQAAEDAENAVVDPDRPQRAVSEREHLQALGQLAGDVAHDINNALSPITAYSDLLLSTMPDLPDIPRQRLERISQAAENVAQIVAHMREFYRPEPDTAAVENMDPARRLESASEPKLDPDLPSTSDTCRPLRILCIDDEAELRQVMHDVLALDHHQVTMAASGREGLDIFQSSLNSGQPYEVVITDLSMPDIDGNNVARAIKEQSPHTPIIMLTGWGSMTTPDGAATPAADAVLSKPPRMQELNNILFQITERTAS